MNIYSENDLIIPMEEPIDINKFNNGQYDFNGQSFQLKDPEHDIKQLIIETNNISIDNLFKGK